MSTSVTVSSGSIVRTTSEVIPSKLEKPSVIVESVASISNELDVEDAVCLPVPSVLTFPTSTLIFHFD